LSSGHIPRVIEPHVSDREDCSWVDAAFAAFAVLQTSHNDFAERGEAIIIVFCNLGFIDSYDDL
jgi:hypothetical protein